MDRLVDPRVIDPDQRLVEYASLEADELGQIVRVMAAMARWRDAERDLGLRSREQMHLGETDMEALRYLVAAHNEERVVTPGALAEHLDISTASTTKLLDRLAAAGHIERAPHPTDGRAVVVRITPQTHERVRDTIGRMHARRFEIARELTAGERVIVIRFLERMSEFADAGAQDPEASGTTDDPRH